MTDNAVWLRDRGVVQVSGPEAVTFLQGVLTNDVEQLEPLQARYAALLTPQGKILFDFLAVLLPGDGGLALDCDASQAAALAKRLSFYKLRAQVVIADASGQQGVVASWGDAARPTPDAIRYADPRAAGKLTREILPLARAMEVGEAPRAAYEALRISLLIPQGGLDFPYGDTFPHDANLDLLHGVDFKKGCYVGQEVVSRMQHRGGVRKRIVRARLDGEAPKPGAAILDGELPVGTLGAAAGRDALALVRTDRAQEAVDAGRPLTVEGVRVTLA